MNSFQVHFGNGKAEEILAHDDKVATQRAMSLIRRWNHPKANVYRTNPFQPDFKKHLATLENPEYDPESPSLQRDPVYSYKEQTSKRKKRKSKQGSGGSTSGPRKDFEVPLKDLADELGIEPSKLRRRLRSSDIEKPEGGWGWNSWEHEDIIKIKSMFDK